MMIPCRSILFLILLSFSFSLASGQVKFKTVVPQHSVAPGESFQVQYILENADEISNFFPPAFPGFRIVSGPNMYSGENPTSYKNLVFTLAAIKEGRFRIYGAACSVKGTVIKSNDAHVTVLTPDPDESPYFLRPGEDPFKKIRENLFLKLTIDKQTCFLGEPLLATFKLYSRLQSKSDVIKNPGFYGFGVYDMVNVSDKVKSEVQLKGHWFDVHTIRKVQLYPLQPGVFTIDAMELANKVEFSRSVVNKQTEQEVTEHMYNNEPQQSDSPAEVYEMKIKTDPVAIHVKPLPVKNIPDTFTGAVGHFSIRAVLEKDTMSRNEENALSIEIAGAGNFQTISGPIVKWPEGIEAFESSVADALDKQKIPLTGERTFKYAFLSSKPGKYFIPPISFSFFHVKTGAYKTVSTKPLDFVVNSNYKEEKKLSAVLAPKGSRSKFNLWIVGLAILISIIALVLWSRFNSAQKNKIVQQQLQVIDVPQINSIEESLKSAELLINDDSKLFYAELHHSIWNYLNQNLNLLGSQLNKTNLSKNLVGKGIDSSNVEELVNLIHQCEVGLYTNAEIDVNKNELFEDAKRILREIEANIR